jgi:hypothetical protein
MKPKKIKVSKKMPPGLRKWAREQNRKHGYGKKQGKKSGKKSGKKTHHGESHVAKSKSKSKGKKGSHGGGKKKGKKKGGGSAGFLGGGGGQVGVGDIVGGAGIGWLEHQMKTDAKFFLNSLPTPVSQVGRLGNVVLLAWGADKLAGNMLPPAFRKGFRQGIKSGATIAAYQFMRKSQADAPFKEGAEVFSISGPGNRNLPYDRGVEQMLGEDDLGALAEEVGRRLRGSFDLELDAPDSPHLDDHPVPDVHEHAEHPDDHPVPGFGPEDHPLPDHAHE